MTWFEDCELKYGKAEDGQRQDERVSAIRERASAMKEEREGKPLRLSSVVFLHLMLISNWLVNRLRAGYVPAHWSG